MKNTIFAILALTMILGCENPSAQYSFDGVTIPTLVTQDEIAVWIWDNIPYKTDGDDGRVDSWQTPEETLTKGTGDCEDRALLAMFLLKRIGINTALMIVVETPNTNHAVVKIDSTLYDIGPWGFYDIRRPDIYEPKGMQASYGEIVKEYSYEDAMNEASNSWYRSLE